ncbi:hypothetical protein RE628_10945 [Paenibacillus sp. D2_2]|uniref:hypothetical protein n=1 Tax=Paenibacillus sp. D2_2 TaxID=3073092 RepID=UPI002814B9FF|nr:hypothetical protein [Paenibacillus sp. D2_2]WMT42759.1 hypothetical protein RE628_10945 [Paenibacillus sp. D2_2]
MMNNSKQIYILLSNPRTIVTKMIGIYTKAPYNHASIAFDSELREMYSFGRKHPLIPLIGGFVKEDIYSGIFERATCAVYSCTVSETTYSKMRNFVRQFEENSELYSYNFLGILGVVLNMEFGGRNSYFCSQFVSAVFERAGLQLCNKSAALTTPDDLSACSMLELIFRGTLVTYRNNCYECPDESALEASHLYLAN